MHFTSLLGVSTLTTLVYAVPVDNRDLGYGDRSAYASAWNAGNAPPSQTFAPTPGGSKTGGGPGNGPQGPPNGPGGPAPDNSQGIPAPPKEANDKPFSLDNGFPKIANPSDALTKINIAARGTLSNAPPPANAPSAETLKSLRLVAFNELFEVYFFTELLKNVTEAVPGYEFQDQTQKKKIIDVLTAVQAQEQLHALNANNALNRFTAEPVQACQYNAGVNNFKDAIFTAATFTDVVMGTLADISVVCSPPPPEGRPALIFDRSPARMATQVTFVGSQHR